MNTTIATRLFSTQNIDTVIEDYCQTFYPRFTDPSTDASEDHSMDEKSGSISRIKRAFYLRILLYFNDENHKSIQIKLL